MDARTARHSLRIQANEGQTGAQFVALEMLDEPVLELVRGCSCEPVRRMKRKTALVIGASSVCDWRVVARRVRDMHLILSWNGAELAIVHACERPELRVEGRLVAPPFPLERTVHVAMGEAIFVVRVPGKNRNSTSADGIADAADDPPTLVSVKRGSGGFALAHAPTRRFGARPSMFRLSANGRSP